MLTLDGPVLRSSTYSSLPPAGPRTWKPEITTPLGEASAGADAKARINPKARSARRWFISFSP
jgi:hypothetical protein